MNLVLKRGRESKIPKSKQTSYLRKVLYIEADLLDLQNIAIIRLYLEDCRVEVREDLPPQGVKGGDLGGRRRRGALLLLFDLQNNTL